MPVPSGKVAIVTGASRGIGRAIARRLAEDGAAVVVAYATRAADADHVVQSILAGGGRAIAVACDVTLEADVRHLFARSAEEFGAPDIVVANA